MGYPWRQRSQPDCLLRSGAAWSQRWCAFMVFPQTLFLLEGMDGEIRVQVQITRGKGLAKAYFPCALHASGACNLRQGVQLSVAHKLLR